MTSKKNPPAPLLLGGTQPLYAQLRERLRADIATGRYARESQLPSESELTEAYGISRITVRQALADLQREGLVVKVQGRGSFVAPARVSQDLARLRGLGASMADSGHRVHGRLLSIAHGVRAGAEVARALAIAPGAAVTEWTSLRSLDAAPLSLNHSCVIGEIGARLASIEFADRDILSVFQGELALRLSHADLDIGAAGATREQARRLKVAAGTPVLRLRRVVYEAGGRPLHVETACYRSDEFSYKVRVEAGER